MVAARIALIRVALVCVALVATTGCKKRGYKYEAPTYRPAGAAAVKVASVPEIKRPVTDLTAAAGHSAGSLTAADTESIARELVDHQAATGVQLAVLIVDTTGGQPIEDFAQQVFEKWGGGSAERNDGALFVLAIGDRRNRLHLGYGLEPVIPDASAKRMLDALRPHLRAANYAAATRQLVATFKARTAHLTPGSPRALPRGASPRIWIVVVVLGLIGGVVWAVMFRKGRAVWRKRPKRWDYKSRPKWYVRAGTAVVDFFRYRPVQLTAGALVAVWLVLLFVFRQGEGYALAYSLFYWSFIPIGWLSFVKRKRVSIPTAIMAIAYVIAAISAAGTEPFADTAMLGDNLYPWLWGFWAGCAGYFFCVVAPINGEGGGGGGSYSGSSSRSSYSSSSSSSSSSRSSSSSSYSGGGGRSGGGGASSSW